MTFIDLEPAARQMADLITGIPDGALDAPTPCSRYSLGDLLDHIKGLTLAFTAAATKSGGEAASKSPSGDRARLGSDWRIRIPRDLAALTDSWREPAARTGMTRDGGVDMPGEVAAVVVLEKLIVHGWDVAVATGQPYGGEEPALEAVRGFIAQFAGPDQGDLRGDAYRAPVAVDKTAPVLDRVIALRGRDPAWSPQ
jgi:uncharacterized protein (TIGR03086 family)